MAKHGLSEIDHMRRELKYREGLLIDYDYAAGLTEGVDGDPVEIVLQEEDENEGNENDEDDDGDDGKNDGKNDDEDSDGDAEGQGGTKTIPHNTPKRGEDVTGVRTVRIF